MMFSDCNHYIKTPMGYKTSEVSGSEVSRSKVSGSEVSRSKVSRSDNLS